MKSKFVMQVLLLAVAAAGLLTILVCVELPNAYLWKAISNFGHLPLFGAFSLVMFGLSVYILGSRVRRRRSHYIIALAATVIVGGVSECFQIAGPRDAGLWDLLRDIGGGISFLCLFMLGDSEMTLHMGDRIRKFRAVVLFVALVIIIPGIFPVGYWASAYWHRSSTFPAICEFESMWESPFREARNAELAVVAAPAGWPSLIGNHVAKLTFRPAIYSEFVVLETCPDWSKFGTLAFEVYSELQTAVFVFMRLEDAYHNNEPDDRFDRRIQVSPGLNRISIPLIDIRRAPIARDMDMGAIRTFSLFVHKPADTFTLYLDNFRLE